MIKYIHIILAILILAVVPLGFSEILPEAYPGRATQTNIDQTAAMGAAITRGLYERCLAAQVDPSRTGLIVTLSTNGGIIEDTNRFTVGTGIYAGSVRDNDSGLIWTRNANIGFMNWTSAVALCESLNDTTNYGFTTWRLPTMSDFDGLVSDIYSDPALCNTSGNGQWTEGDAFDDVISGPWGPNATDEYWAEEYSSGYAYTFLFYEAGGGGTIRQKTKERHVWAVCEGEYPPNYETGPDCSGTYVGAHPSWSQESWYCVYYANNETYYITQDPNYPPSPSWSKSGSNPSGTYSTRNGTGIWGVATAVTNTWQTGGGYWQDDPVMRSHVLIKDDGGGGSSTSTIFYQCWLTKIVCTNDVFSSTNVEHQTTYFYKPVLPTAGTSNWWDDQDIGLSSNVWNEEEVGSWSFGTNNPVIFGEDRSDPPINTQEPVIPNQPNCTGFKCLEFKAIVDWRFQYCTNNY